MSVPAQAERVKQSHIWAREEHEHYVEPEWCSRRLFEVEKFEGTVQDPCCGFGRIVQAATAAGLPSFGTDIVDRGFVDMMSTTDFLDQTTKVGNIVSNPPFDRFGLFAMHALKLAQRKVAMIWIVPRLNAAGWLRDTPLARVLLLTPRPSMPPGHTITAGDKPKGDTRDFCWLVWDQHHTGPPSIDWLHRDQ